jgi:WD40 repeat protein
LGGRRRKWHGVLAAGCVLSLGLGLAWSTVPGKVLLADIYWELVLGLHLINPATYVGPHFWAVSASPDGRVLAVGGMHRDVLLFDTATGESLPSPMRHEEWVMEVLWSPDGRWFASTSFSGSVHVQEVATGRSVAAFERDEVAYTIAFHPTRPLLAWGSYDGLLSLVDLETGAAIRSFPGNEEGVLFTAFTPSGEGLVAAGEDGVIRFFDPDSGELVRTLEGHDGGVTSVGFTPDGRLAVSGGDDGTVRLWDLTSEEVLRVSHPHKGWVNFSTFLPDGERYVTVGTDDDVFVWAVDGGLVQRLPGHADWLMCVRSFPGGDRFVTTGKDGTVRVWDSERLQVVRTIDVWASIDDGARRLPAL